MDEPKTAVLNFGECRKCGCCVRSCPVGAIEYTLGGLKITEECVLCGSCVKACPFNALRLPEE